MHFSETFKTDRFWTLLIAQAIFLNQAISQLIFDYDVKYLTVPRAKQHCHRPRLQVGFLHRRNFTVKLDLILSCLTREKMSQTQPLPSEKQVLHSSWGVQSDWQVFLFQLDSCFLRELTHFWAQLNSLFSRRKFHPKDLTQR